VNRGARFGRHPLQTVAMPVTAAYSFTSLLTAYTSFFFLSLPSFPTFPCSATPLCYKSIRSAIMPSLYGGDNAHFRT
jgi:hypothetical protein